jgi:D-tyrosyl-tRNA(Tyr) deacylase
MRIVLQRVKSAKVRTETGISASIATGLLLLVAVARTDTSRDVEYMADRVTGLRIFPDDQGKMNLSLVAVGGSALIVSNFTLYGDCTRGRRPGFELAAPPEHAKVIYTQFVDAVRMRGIPVQTGVFQAHMLVELENDGPVTLICDSKSLAVTHGRLKYFSYNR